jgi:glycosyltransferase involved in cell wall biosynthesis
MSGTVSVVITSYNQRPLLEEAVASVLAQTVPAGELVICDDASTDDSPAYISNLEEKHPGLVRGVLREVNVGIAANRSEGLRSARGDLITWLDGDDRFLPAKLERETALLAADGSCGWVYSQVRHVDGEGREQGLRYQDPPAGSILGELVSMLGAAPRNPLIRKEVLARTGYFRGDLELYEDFDFCLRLAAASRAAFCPEILVEYRIHDSGLHCENLDRHERALRRIQFHFSRAVTGLSAPERQLLESLLAQRIDTVLADAAAARRRR